MATTAVILLASGTLAFSIVLMSAALSYSDLIMKREMRIQAGLHVESCLDTAELMIAKDVFLNGEVAVSDFNCSARITKQSSSDWSIQAQAFVSDVSATDSRMVHINPF